MSETTSSTDILRLFREDLDSSDRVQAFQQAAEQLSDQVDQLASPERVAEINDKYEVLFVFNSHGDKVHAAQSINAGGSPFITFVEGVGAPEVRDNYTFGASISNAFDMRFNGKPAMLPPAQKDLEDFGYWRDRGLMARGSLIVDVDIRHYSRRLLDALMGNDYDQQFLNKTLPGYEIMSKDLDTLIEDQATKGKLIMYSNAVRELTSTKQILETLQQLEEVEEGNDSFGQENSDKLRALLQKPRLAKEKIPVNIIYGSGHHTMMHVFRGLGINANRVFAGKDDSPGNLKTYGSINDQFFSAHPFGLTDEQVEKYSKQLVLQGMLSEPIENSVEYGIIPVNRRTDWYGPATISKIARKPELVDRIEELHQEFQSNPLVLLPALYEAGLEFVPIDQAEQSHDHCNCDD